VTATHAEAVAAEPARISLRIYAMDGALLGLFMISACVSVVAVEHPASPIRALIGSDLARRALVGLAMGITAVTLIYSRWGKRSGAFLNPALILCLLRLGKLEPRAALGYIVAQFLGASLGVAACSWSFHAWLSHPAVNYLLTEPGAAGAAVAWLGELGIGFLMLSTVMTVNRAPRWAPYSGGFAAALVALFITFEAPLSGMSLNPARSFASAVVAGSFRFFWIYLSAPTLGMLLGVELQRRLEARHARLCGKLNHSETVACFVRCNCLERTRSKSS
jgi:aquaporin Z